MISVGFYKHWPYFQNNRDLPGRNKNKKVDPLAYLFSLN